MPAFLRRVLERHRRRDLERGARRVDVVVAAVEQRRLDVDDRVAGEDAAAHRVADALLDRGDELLRDDAADDVVLEHVAGAGLARADLEPDVAVHAVAAASA